MGNWLNKLGYLHTMEYYTAIKKKKKSSLLTGKHAQLLSKRKKKLQNSIYELLMCKNINM